MRKINIKRVCAAVLGITLLTVAIIPYIGQKKVEAFSSAYGVCIDNHNASTSGAWSKNDKYSNKLLDMNAYTHQEQMNIKLLLLRMLNVYTNTLVLMSKS